MRKPTCRRGGIQPYPDVSAQLSLQFSLFRAKDPRPQHPLKLYV